MASFIFKYIECQVFQYQTIQIKIYLAQAI